MSNWIDLVLEETREVESPTEFIYWGAICAISAVMGKKVSINIRGAYRVFPNIYVMLLARSGAGKSFPAKMAKKLVSIVGNVRIVSGRNSIQAILENLGNAFTTESGEMITTAHALLHAQEFTNLIIKDPQALGILTDLYDTADHEPVWENTLKSGLDSLKEPCITMIAASNDAHFMDKVSPIDIEGGFIGRTMLIRNDEPDRINDSLDDLPPINFERLAEHLKVISKIEGNFNFHEHTKELWKPWYREIKEELSETGDNTGTAERMHVHVLKTAMCLALAKGEGLILTPEAFIEAKDKCEPLIRNVKATLGTGSKSGTSSQMMVVIRELLVRPDNKVTRMKLLQKYNGSMNYLELDVVIETLEQAGAIEIERINKQVTYKMLPEYVSQFKKFYAAELGEANVR